MHHPSCLGTEMMCVLMHAGNFGRTRGMIMLTNRNAEKHVYVFLKLIFTPKATRMPVYTSFTSAD